MPEENQPPKRRHHAYRKQYGALPEELKQAMKADWFSGQLNTVQISEKYKIERERILCFVRFWWGKEAKRLSITTAKEPPIIRRVYGKVAWNNAKLDFLAGIDIPDIAHKYNIPERLIEYTSYKKKWRLEREKMYADGKSVIAAKIQSSSAEMAIRYDGFAKAAMEQIDVMTEKLKVMSAEGTCTPDRLKLMIDSLGGLISMGMKIYGVEKHNTQINNQFIRLNVLDDSAAATMNHLAKTLNLKSA